MPTLHPSSLSCCPATHTLETAVLQRRIPSFRTYNIGRSGLKTTYRDHDKVKRAKRVMHWIVREPPCEENIVAAFWHWSDQDIGKMARDELQRLYDSRW